jgi:hypothetical protein
LRSAKAAVSSTAGGLSRLASQRGLRLGWNKKVLWLQFWQHRGQHLAKILIYKEIV